MNNYQKTVDLALRQHNVFARYQLANLGIAEGSCSKVLKSQLFERVAKGIYKLRSSEKSWHQDAMLAVLSCGQSSLLSHKSALINLGLISANEKTKRRSDLIDVTGFRNLYYYPNAQFHRTKYVRELERATTKNRIPQVNVELAIIDGSIYLFDNQIASVIDQAFRKSLVTFDSLSRALKTFKPAPGRKKSLIREVLNDYSGMKNDLLKVESSLELRIVRCIKKHFSYDVIPQHQVRIDGSTYRIDLAIKELRIAIEVDGFEFHRSRYSFDSDRVRQNALVAAGWTILRFTSKHTNEQILQTISSTIPRWR